MKRWKKWELALLLGLCAALMWGAWSAQRQDALARKMIRLHVIANSDSDADQALKLQVRDKVLNFTENVLQCSDDMEDAQERLRDAQFHLYDDLQSGLIPKAQYLQFQKRYETEIAAQEVKIEQLNQCLIHLKEARQQDDEFVAFFQKYGNIQKLDWDTVNQLIQKVVFHDKQHVDIYFRFADEYEKLCGIANVIHEQETVLCS